jgi:hypothetical protein
MKGFPENVSKSVKLRNPHLYPVGPLRSAYGQQNDPPTLERKPSREKPSRDRVEKGSKSVLRIGFIMCRRTLQDGDNAIAGCKFLRDAVCHTLGVDDGDLRIEFYYHQIVSKDRGMIVKITVL